MCPVIKTPSVAALLPVLQRMAKEKHNDFMLRRGAVISLVGDYLPGPENEPTRSLVSRCYDAQVVNLLQAQSGKAADPIVLGKCRAQLAAYFFPEPIVEDLITLWCAVFAIQAPAVNQARTPNSESTARAKSATPIYTPASPEVRPRATDYAWGPPSSLIQILPNQNIRFLGFTPLVENGSLVNAGQPVIELSPSYGEVMPLKFDPKDKWSFWKGKNRLNPAHWVEFFDVLFRPRPPAIRAPLDSRFFFRRGEQSPSVGQEVNQYVSITDYAAFLPKFQVNIPKEDLFAKAFEEVLFCRDREWLWQHIRYGILSSTFSLVAFVLLIGGFLITHSILSSILEVFTSSGNFDSRKNALEILFVTAILAPLLTLIATCFSYTKVKAVVFLKSQGLCFVALIAPLLIFVVPFEVKKFWRSWQATDESEKNGMDPRSTVNRLCWNEEWDFTTKRTRNMQL